MPDENRRPDASSTQIAGASQASSIPDARLLAVLKSLLLWPLGLAAVLTVLTHVAQQVQLTFGAYVQYLVAAAVTVTLVYFIKTRPRSFTLGAEDVRTLLAIVAVCLVGSAIALLINHPADDDYFYLPNAVYFLQHPQAPMGYAIHFLFSGGEPFTSVFWATSGAYEYIQAGVAYAFKADYLTVYYVVATAVTGFMIPFALFLVLAKFSNGIRSALSGTLIALGGITLLGETPRTFGSHSLAHPFQGIVVVLSVILPLFAFFTLDYFEKPTARSWLALMSVATAGAGTSSSTVFLLPALGLTLAVAQVIAGPRPGRVLRQLPKYFAAMSYLAAYAVFILVHGATELGSSSPANYAWPQDFVGHLQFLINSAAPMTAAGLVLTTCLGILLLRGRHRILLAAWVASACVLFLNPLVAPLLIRYATSPNAYWRMFYILPFPLTIGIVASSLYASLDRVSLLRQHGALALAFIVLALGNVVVPEASIFHGSHVELGLSRYKLAPNLIQSARQVVDAAPPGPMLAPSLLGGTVVLFDSDMPQVRIKKDPVRVWLYARGKVEDAAARIKASDFLEGRPNGDIAALDEVLREYPEIRSVVARRPVYAADDVKALLAQQGFTNAKKIEGYVVAWRAP